MAVAKKTESLDTLARALDAIRPGSTVYWRIAHRSQSGMGRWLRFYYVASDGRIAGATHYVGAARGTGCAFKNGEATVQFSGCGYCAGSEAVDDLSRALGYTGQDALRAERL